MFTTDQFVDDTLADFGIEPWREPELDPADIANWIQTKFYIPETNAPMQLYPSQITPLQEGLRTKPDGTFVYSTVMWGAIKKSAKTSIAAAVGMWFAWRKPFSSVKVMGNDLDQAQSRVFEYMKRAILLNPEWNSQCKVSQTTIKLPNNSVIKAIPVDPYGESGGNDDLTLYTELWGWKLEAHERMWSEMTQSPTKRGYSLRWCESYAGYSGESTVLERLYEHGVTHGELINADYEMYANGEQFTLWQTRPSLPWQTPEYYKQQYDELREADYQRQHENAWVTSTSAFVPDAWWTACKGEVAPRTQYQSCVVALDAAVSGDCFGIVCVSRTADGVVQVRTARQWTPPKNGAILFSDPHDKDNPDTPEGFVRLLAQQYPVAEFAYDPFQLHDFCSRLRRDGVGNFREFPQGADRLKADKQLQDLIKDRRIAHDGNLHDLTAHIANANAKSNDDKTLRIVKREDHGKPIDLCVALSMASARALHLNIG